MEISGAYRLFHWQPFIGKVGKTRKGEMLMPIHASVSSVHVHVLYIIYTVSKQSVKTSHGKTTTHSSSDSRPSRGPGPCLIEVYKLPSTAFDISHCRTREGQVPEVYNRLGLIWSGDLVIIEKGHLSIYMVNSLLSGDKYSECYFP